MGDRPVQGDQPVEGDQPVAPTDVVEHSAFSIQPSKDQPIAATENSELRTQNSVQPSAFSLQPSTTVPPSVLGSLVVFAFLLQPALHTLNLFEFHLIPYAIPALAWLLWAIEGRRPWLAFIIAILALTVKEEMAIVGVAVGIYAAAATGQRRLGATIAGISLVWGALVMGILMPALSTVGGGFYYLRRYAQYGDSAPAILWTLASQPGIVFGDLFGPERLRWYWQLLAPWAGFSLLAPVAFALTFPTFLYLGLGNSPGQYSIDFHYQAPLLPLIAFAAIRGTRRLGLLGVNQTVSGAILLATSVAAFWIASPLRPAPGYVSGLYQHSEHAEVTDRLVRQVPEGAPVSAGRNLVSQFSQRQRVYNFPTLRDAEYVVMDMRGLVYPGFYEVDEGAVRRLIRDSHYWLAWAEDGVWFFRAGEPVRPTPERSLNVRFGGRYRLLGYDLRAERDRSRLTLWWQAEQEPDDRYTVFAQLFDPSGRRVWQHDSEPLDGLVPTVEWPVGRVLPDIRWIDTRGLPTGSYRLVLGLYEFGGGDRLPAEGSTLPDAVEIQVTVNP